MIQFERIYVINLKKRPERLKAFFQRLEDCHWPFQKPTVFDAIDGVKVGMAEGFKHGPGAYGCRESHLRLLQDCLMQDVGSVLILEDDALPCENFAARVNDFLDHVPDDWEGLMLGGEPIEPHYVVNEYDVWRVRHDHRTHAYAARGSYLRGLQMRWAGCNTHIDWAMANWQYKFKVYCPGKWLMGQDRGRSDVENATEDVRWFNAG